LQRKRNGSPVLKLLSLTETLADERRRTQEEEAAQRLLDVSARKNASQAERIKKKEEQAQKERSSSSLGALGALGTLGTLGGEEGGGTGGRGGMGADVEPDLRPRWEVVADLINSAWKEGIEVDGHSIVVTASAINAALAKGGVGNRNELWSSESELDFSDQEIDMSRSELRLVVTVYAPALAETASATVPTLVVSQLLGAPLEHLGGCVGQGVGHIDEVRRHSCPRRRHDGGVGGGRERRQWNQRHQWNQGKWGGARCR